MILSLLWVYFIQIIVPFKGKCLSGKSEYIYKMSSNAPPLGHTQWQSESSWCMYGCFSSGNNRFLPGQWKKLDKIGFCPVSSNFFQTKLEESGRNWTLIHGIYLMLDKTSVNYRSMILGYWTSGLHLNNRRYIQIRENIEFQFHSLGKKTKTQCKSDRYVYF